MCGTCVFRAKELKAELRIKDLLGRKFNKKQAMLEQMEHFFFATDLGSERRQCGSCFLSEECQRSKSKEYFDMETIIYRGSVEPVF